MDIIGVETFVTENIFDYKCEVLRFSDHQIRFVYFMDPNKIIEGVVTNSSHPWNKNIYDLEEEFEVD